MLEKLEDAGGLKGPKRFSFFRCGWSPVLVSCLVVLWGGVACCSLLLLAFVTLGVRWLFEVLF